MKHKRILVVTSVLSLAFGASIFSFTQHTPSTLEVKADNSASNYYESVTASLSGSDLKEELRKITTANHTKYGYDSLEVAMRTTDRNWDLSPDPEDENPYMVLLYAEYNVSNPQLWNTSHGSYGISDGNKAVWNKEHIWAKSNGFNSKGLFAYSDLHHLRASDKVLNNARSSYTLGVVANHNSSTAKKDHFGNVSTNYLSNDIFEPTDNDKGDVARALLYMATRYYTGDGTGGTKLNLVTGESSKTGVWGHLEDLIKWNQVDQPDTFEIRRNGLVQEMQGNRNPYIDHPEYVCRVWGNTNDTTKKLCASDPYPGKAPTAITLSDESIELSVIETKQVSVSSVTPSDASKSVTWSSSDSTIAKVNSSGLITAVKEGSCTVTATSSSAENVKATISISVKPPVPVALANIDVAITKTSLFEGETAQIRPILVPSNAYPTPVFSYESSNNDVTKVSDSGVVVAVKEGSATITIKAVQNEIEKSKTISVSVSKQTGETLELVTSNTSLSDGDKVVIVTDIDSGVGVTGAGSKDATISNKPEEWKLYEVKSSSAAGFKLYDDTSKSYIADQSSNSFGYDSNGGALSVDSSGRLLCSNGNRYLAANGSYYRFYSTSSSYSAFHVYKVAPQTPPEPTLIDIEIVTPPNKTTYNVGEDFDSTGLVVKAIYSNETKVVINDYTISGFDSFASGTKNIQISYDNFVKSFTVTIDEPQQQIDEEDDTEDEEKPVSSDDNPAEDESTDTDKPTGDDTDKGAENTSNKSCGGNIIGTSFALSILSFVGISLLILRKNKYN